MRKTKKRTVATALVTAALLVLNTAGAMAQEIGDSGEDPFYLKEDGLYQYSLDGSGSSKLMDISNIGSEYSEYLFDMAEKSMDGRYTYYFKDYNSEESKGTLCYLDSQNPGTEQIIGADIAAAVFLDNTRLLYAAPDYKIYIYTFGQGAYEDPDLYDISDIYVNPDHTKLVWTAYDNNYDKNLFAADLSGGGFNKRRLDSDISRLRVSDDLSTIYYESYGKLCRIKDLGARQEIADDLYRFEVIDNTGSVYYMTNQVNRSNNPSRTQWFEDDMALSDRSLEIPDKSQYQTAVTAEDGTVSYILDRDKYYEALDKYMEKLKRDELRSWVSDYYYYDYYDYYGYGSSNFDLYYFNGQSSQKVAEGVSDFGRLSTSKDMVTAEFTTQKQIKHYKMSEITDVNAFKEEVENVYKENNTIIKAVINGNLTDFPFSTASSETIQIFIDESQNLFYFLNDWTENGTGTLKTVSFSGGAFGEPWVVDTEVSGLVFRTDYLLYKKEDDKEDKSQSLFLSPTTLVDSGVQDTLWSDDTLYYFKNMDRQNTTATLYCWKNSKSVMIADGVRQFQSFKNGSIGLLKDYDKQQKAGNLYLWREDTGASMVDSGVKALKDALYPDSFFYSIHYDYD